jgi:HPt (histidine-containing phosphotransfer) domain-containing protein
MWWNQKLSVGGEDAVNASSQLSVTCRDPEPSVIDEGHLWRMTLGDRRLEREVLQIFVRQTAILLERIAGAEPALAAAAAHTLVGSARGIGAWRMARAAERLEYAAGGQSALSAPVMDLMVAVGELTAAAMEASAAINVRLRNPDVAPDC